MAFWAFSIDLSKLPLGCGALEFPLATAGWMNSSEE